MTHKFYPEFWTSSWPKDYFCYDIKRICELYKEKITKAFEDPQRSADELQKKMLEHPDEYCEGIQDESDFSYMMEKRIFHEYDIIKDMQYRTRLLWICCILEIWEQNLSSCIVQDLNNSRVNEGDKLTDSQANNLYNGLSTFKLLFSNRMFEKSNRKCTLEGLNAKCVLEEFPRYKEIEELNYLVNAIKHGQGQSLDNLYKRYPKYRIKGQGIHEMFAETTIFTQTLNVNDDDFFRFGDVLIDFWRWIPRHIVITNLNDFKDKILDKNKGGS